MFDLTLLPLSLKESLYTIGGMKLKFYMDKLMSTFDEGDYNNISFMKFYYDT